VVVSLCLIRARQLGDTLILKEQVLKHILKYGLGVLGLDICEVALVSKDDCPRWDTIHVIDGKHAGTCSSATF